MPNAFTVAPRDIATPHALQSIRVIHGASGRLKLLHILGRQLRRVERDGQLIDLAVEGKRHVIIAIIDGRAGIRPNIEGFIPGKGERDRAIHHVRRDDFAIDPQRSGSRATKPADIVEGERRKPQPVIFEVIDERMLTRRKRLGRLPFHPFQVEQVPGEDRLALEQIETIAAEIGHLASRSRRRPHSAEPRSPR